MKSKLELFFFPLFIYISNEKDHGGFFSKQAEILTRSSFDKKPEVTELVG